MLKNFNKQNRPPTGKTQIIAKEATKPKQQNWQLNNKTTSINFYNIPRRNDISNNKTI